MKRGTPKTCQNYFRKTLERGVVDKYVEMFIHANIISLSGFCHI